MLGDAEPLPQDPAELRVELRKLRTKPAQAQATLKHRDLEIERLKAPLAALRRRQYGHSSEQLGAEVAQLEFGLQALEAPSHTESQPDP